MKAASNGGNASSALGEWLSEESSGGGFRSSLAFSCDGRVRLAMGVTVGSRWQLREQQDDRYIVQLTNRAKPEEGYAIELRIVRGKKAKLVQRSLPGGETIKMTFIARGHQPEKPAFLGRWTYSLEGAPVLQDYNEDGWAWTRIVFRTAIGSYRVESDRVVFDWKGVAVPLQGARLEGQELIVESEDGQDSRFLRPKVAVAQTKQPEAGESTMERLIPTIVTGADLLDKRIFQEFEMVGEVSDIRLADLHPTPGEELGINGSHGAVLLDGGGNIVHEVRFTDPAGAVEMVDLQADASTEFMNRGGGW